MTTCQDCNRPYGDEHGFPDLIIPFDAWRRISPSHDDGGLLCPSCICKRLHRAGIRCTGAFVSGPIISVSEPVMNVLRRIENVELAIEGRDNRWAGIRPLIDGAPGTPVTVPPPPPDEDYAFGGPDPLSWLISRAIKRIRDRLQRRKPGGEV